MDRSKVFIVGLTFLVLASASAEAAVHCAPPRKGGAADKGPGTVQCEIESAKAAVRVGPGYFPKASIIITDASHSLKLDVMMKPSDAENPSALNEEVEKIFSERPNYILVYNSCGGGNAWRCDREYVVRRSDLRNLGEVAPQGGADETPDSGKSLSAGLFKDIYDHLESNGITPHAGAPGVKIIVRERNDNLYVDPELTTELNKDRLTAALSAVQDTEKPDAAAFLYAALFAKYLDRQKSYVAVMAKAKTVLDQDDFRNLQNDINRVHPFELP